MSNSPYGGGFAIRMIILVLILGLVGGSMYNDLYNKKPASEKTVEKLMALVDTETDDGHGIPKDVVRKAAGMDPAYTFKVDKYEIDEFRFARTIPFFSLRTTYVVYDEGRLYTIFDNPKDKPTLAEITKGSVPAFVVKPVPDVKPVAVASGGPPPEENANAKDDEKSDDSKKEGDAAAEKKDDGAAEKKDDGAAEKSEEKKEGSAEPPKTEEKKDDGEKKDDPGKGG